jgi:NADH-ubiquinone oxidoreductase chain 2
MYSIILLISTISTIIRRDLSILLSRSSLCINVICSILSFINLSYNYKNIGIFGGLFFITPIVQTFKFFIFFVSSIILTLTSFFPIFIINGENAVYSSRNNISLNSKLDNFNEKREYTNLDSFKQMLNFNDFSLIKKSNEADFLVKNSRSEQFRIIEYTLIIILTLTGSMFLLATSDFISLFLCIELQSYGLYLICSIYKNSEFSTSAGLTYFLLGGLASCFILLGISIIYSNSANMNIDGLYVITDLSSTNLHNLDMLPSNDIYPYTYFPTYLYLPDYILYSLLILSVGLLFKISAAPFHF